METFGTSLSPISKGVLTKSNFSSRQCSVGFIELLLFSLLTQFSGILSYVGFGEVGLRKGKKWRTLPSSGVARVKALAACHLHKPLYWLQHLLYHKSTASLHIASSLHSTASCLAAQWTLQKYEWRSVWWATLICVVVSNIDLCSTQCGGGEQH